MIAVIETGGKQYIVKKGDVFVVDRLDETLDSHTFTPLLVSDGTDTQVGAPLVDGMKVVCDVLEHVRADKVRVFKMKSKKHYHRTRGFRACQTQLKVVSISA
ncbi:MAG: 50S ribosomal protein L21 [Candidatus Gracilibacteria bacterium]